MHKVFLTGSTVGVSVNVFAHDAEQALPEITCRGKMRTVGDTE